MIATCIGWLVLAGFAVGGLLVILAGVMRCPRCGGWHNSQDEQDECCR